MVKQTSRVNSVKEKRYIKKTWIKHPNQIHQVESIWKIAIITKQRCQQMEIDNESWQKGRFRKHTGGKKKEKKKAQPRFSLRGKSDMENGKMDFRRWL